MGLKYIEDNIENVDEAFRSLYTKQGDEYVLTGVEGVVPEADLTRVKGALEKERNDHRGLRKTVSGLGDIEEVKANLARIPELELLAQGKVDDKKIESIVEGRLSMKLAPLQRQLTESETRKAELEGEVARMQELETTRTLHDTVRSAAKKAGLKDVALEDAIGLAEKHFQRDESGNFVVKTGVNGMTPGVTPEVWFTQLKEKRPHWWGDSGGGGARGSSGGGTGGAVNPFSGKDWNLTEQAKLIREDRNRAEQLAKAAGTTIGGKRPVVAK